MWTRTFWAQTGERAVKTAAQVGLGLLVTSDGVGLGLLQVNWAGGLSLVGSAVLASVLTSIASGAVDVGAAGSPSLIAPESGRHQR